MGSTLRIALPKIARTDMTPQEVTALPTKEVEATGIGSKVEDEEEEVDSPPFRENGDGKEEEACSIESLDAALDVDIDDDVIAVFFPLRSCIVLASVWRGHTDMMIMKLNTSTLR